MGFKDHVAEMFREQANGDIEKVITRFATPVDFNIQGAENIPWIPEEKPLPNIRVFFEGLANHIESRLFDVNTLVGDGDTVVALGKLISRVRSTDRDIHTDFAIEIRFDSDGLISKYHMYEDTYAVAVALGRA